MKRTQKLILSVFGLSITILNSPLRAENPPTIGQQELALAVGEQRSIDVVPGTRFSVGNTEAIAVKVAPLEGGRAILVVRGKASGFSDLLILPPTGAIQRIGYRVSGKKLSKNGQVFAGDAAGLRLNGLEVIPQAEGLVATGAASDLQSFNRAQAVLSASGNRKKIDLMQLPSVERKKAEQEIVRVLREAGLPALKVRGAGKEIIVRGEVRDAQEKELVERLVGAIFPSAILQLRSPFVLGQVLRFKVQILEVLKTNSTRLGIEWGDSVPQIIQIHRLLTKGNFSLEASLSALERKGWAKVLSRPEVAVNAEGVAELKVGGEIPIVSRSRQYAGVVWKPYGLYLKLEVPGARIDSARTNITVEVSTLDQANAIDGIPATKVNRLQTVMDLQLQKTTFLSGLLQEQGSEAVKQLPVLGDIPILGALFRSKDYQNNKSELVIAITALEEKQANGISFAH